MISALDGLAAARAVQAGETDKIPDYRTNALFVGLEILAKEIDALSAKYDLLQERLAGDDRLQVGPELANLTTAIADLSQGLGQGGKPKKRKK